MIATCMSVLDAYNSVFHIFCDICFISWVEKAHIMRRKRYETQTRIRNEKGKEEVTHSSSQVFRKVAHVLCAASDDDCRTRLIQR